MPSGCGELLKAGALWTFQLIRSLWCLPTRWGGGALRHVPPQPTSPPFEDHLQAEPPANTSDVLTDSRNIGEHHQWGSLHAIALLLITKVLGGL